MSRRRNKEREVFQTPQPEEFLTGYALAFRWPHSLRKGLEIAASERSTSVAGFIEQILLEKLIRIGLIETRRGADEEA
jgi:hypothetical protein